MWHGGDLLVSSFYGLKTVCHADFGVFGCVSVILRDRGTVAWCCPLSTV